MTDFYTIESIVIAAHLEIPDYKIPFIPMFLRPIVYGEAADSQYDEKAIITNRLKGTEYLKNFKVAELEYYTELEDFIVNKLQPYFSRNLVSNRLCNKLISLAVLMPDICKFLHENKSSIPQYDMSRRFLSIATFGEVPNEYFLNLSVIMMVENEAISLKRVKNLQEFKLREKQIETLTTLYHSAYEILHPIAKLSIENTYLTEGAVKPEHVYINNGRSYPIEWFNGSNAQSIILIGGRGSGKTTGTLRIIYSAWKSGYTVLVMGEDTRKEFRYAYHPLLSTTVTRNYLATLRDKQHEKPEGLPMTIYTNKDDIKYPACERDSDSFKGTKEEWNSLSGVVLFENDWARVMKSFIDWRSDDKTKPIILVINEAQNVIPTITTKGKWHAAKEASEFLVQIRGNGCPIVLNTQSLFKIHKEGRAEKDLLFAGYMGEDSDRKKVALDINRKELRVYLSRHKLKETNTFLFMYQDKMHYVKFLLPPCQPETTKKSLPYFFNKSEA